MELTYKAPVKDIAFALEAAGVGDERYKDIPNIDDVRSNGDAMKIMLTTADELIQDQLLLLYNKQGRVTYDSATKTASLPEGYEKAYKDYVGAGLQGISAAEKDGGTELPRALDAAVAQMLFAGNNSFTLIRALTKSVYEGIRNNAADAEAGNAEGKLSTQQRDIMLEKLASGQWSGVMSMTEGNAGSDLSNIQTTATQQEDGSYKVQGEKQFISASDNQYALADKDGNVIHLVLAKIVDDNGTDKGISLMAIPKYHIKDRENLGEKNRVNIGPPEKKLGMHESITTPVHYDDAKGWLVGERGKGMAAMFDVMNEARRAIGRQTLGIADIAEQNALKYATEERHMGRAAHGAEVTKEDADPIAVHPAVREMLLKNRAFVQGARVLDFITELEADKAELGDEQAKRWVQLTTNMVKYHLTEEGHATADRAIQIYGGNGYLEEYRVGGLANDARVTRIYEGTNQIQAVALVGRQLPNMRAFEKQVEGFLSSVRGDRKYIKPLQEGMDALVEATTQMQSLLRNDKNAANAAATHYVELFSKVAVGYAWARAAELAQKKLLDKSLNNEEKLDMETKLATANFYMQRVLLPHIKGQHTLLGAGMDTLAMPDLNLRRQDVPIEEQLAATDLGPIAGKLGKRGTPDAKEVAIARVARLNRSGIRVTEAEQRDIEFTAAQVKEDLTVGTTNPVAEAVKAEVSRLERRKQVTPGSALADLLERSKEASVA